MVFVDFKVICFTFFSGQSKNEALVPKKQETAEEIFTELNSKPTSAARRLVLLNGFIKLINSNTSKDELNAYSVEEILIRYVISYNNVFILTSNLKSCFVQQNIYLKKINLQLKDIDGT